MLTFWLDWFNVNAWPGECVMQ